MFVGEMCVIKKGMNGWDDCMRFGRVNHPIAVLSICINHHH